MKYNKNKMLKKAIGLAVGIYALSCAPMFILGIPIKFPWALILILGLSALPIASVLAIYGIKIESILVKKYIIRFGGVVSGFLLVSFFQLDFTIIYIGLVCLVILSAWNFQNKALYLLTNIAYSFLFMVICYAIISNLNYLALKISVNDLNDVLFQRIDMALYKLFIGGEINYIGLFPLLKNDSLFKFFENAYGLLFFSIFIALFLITLRGGDIIEYFLVLFRCYFFGLLIFVIFPVVGPCIYFPNSFSSQFHGTITHKVMIGFLDGYDAVKRGVYKESGVGYFVAFPSLHVAVSIVVQYYCRSSLFIFWMMFPIATAIVVSTFFLGYHYLVDIPAGVLTAVCSILLYKSLKLFGEKDNYT